jgi:nucleoside 2-deoxyribosyltransferase
MKIYFAASIRGGRDNSDIYYKIIKYLESFSTVLTEHVGSLELTSDGESFLSDKKIYERDLFWLKGADCVIAEVTSPSLGVGYEIGIAEKLNLPILCLYNNNLQKKISAMLLGNNSIICKKYNSISKAKKEIDDFIKEYF